MLVKHALIIKKLNPFSSKFDYLLILTENQFNAFREFGLNAKEVGCDDDKGHYITVYPYIEHDGMSPYAKQLVPSEDDFLACYDIDINFKVHEFKLPNGKVVTRLFFTKNDIKDNNPLPKEKRCPVGNSALFK